MWKPTVSSDELYHHGILGMRWGKKNGPPYPLGSNISTGSRLKKTFVSGSSKTQDKNSGYYAKKSPSKMRREQGKPVSIYELKMNDPEFKKKVLIGAAIVGGTALAAYGAYKLGSLDKLGDIGLKGSTKIDQLLKLNKGGADFLNNIDDLAISTGLDKNSKMISIVESCKKVNPGFATGSPEYKNNCFSAVTADLLNRANNGKGLNVVARAATEKEILNHGISFDDLTKPYSGVSIDDIILPKDKLSSAKDLMAQSLIDKCGSNGFGAIRVRLSSNSSIGHFIKFEIKDGECIFSDSLSGTIGADKYFRAMSTGQIARQIEYCNVNGLMINPFEISKLVKSG